jgi:hypothetical protein
MTNKFTNQTLTHFINIPLQFEDTKYWKVGEAIKKNKQILPANISDEIVYYKNDTFEITNGICFDITKSSFEEAKITNNIIRRDRWKPLEKIRVPTTNLEFSKEEINNDSTGSYFKYVFFNTENLTCK